MNLPWSPGAVMSSETGWGLCCATASMSSVSPAPCLSHSVSSMESWICRCTFFMREVGAKNQHFIILLIWSFSHNPANQSWSYHDAAWAKCLLQTVPKGKYYRESAEYSISPYDDYKDCCKYTDIRDQTILTLYSFPNTWAREDTEVRLAWGLYWVTSWRLIIRHISYLSAESSLPVQGCGSPTWDWDMIWKTLFLALRGRTPSLCDGYVTDVVLQVPSEFSGPCSSFTEDRKTRHLWLPKRHHYQAATPKKS